MMSSGIIMDLKERSLDGHLFKHMHRLMDKGYGAEIWRNGGTIAQLLMIHFIRMEDPDTWAETDGMDYTRYVEAMKMLRETLFMNPHVCQLLEGLWSSRADIATYINSTSIQQLAGHLINIHSKFVMGCGKYLSCSLKPGWSANIDVEARFLTVQSAVTTYLTVVQNLPLDGGHWHELWAAGDNVALCLMEHFLIHEDQRDERWSAEHVRSPAKYLNRNLQNLRDVIAANPDVCEMLSALKVARPDIWSTIDGRALQRIANCLRGMDLLLGCANFLAQNLVGSWQESASNPRAEVQRYIDMYVSNVFQMLGQQSPIHTPSTTPSFSPRTSQSNSSFPVSSGLTSPPHTPRSSHTNPAFNTTNLSTSLTPAASPRFSQPASISTTPRSMFSAPSSMPPEPASEGVPNTAPLSPTLDAVIAHPQQPRSSLSSIQFSSAVVSPRGSSPAHDALDLWGTQKGAHHHDWTTSPLLFEPTSFTAAADLWGPASSSTNLWEKPGLLVLRPQPSY